MQLLREPRQTLAADAVAGFLVSLVAIPLCMGIAIASGFPPIAGIVTAVVGGLVAPLISNSEMTIKGPAAGLIVVLLGCIHEFGFTGGHDVAADLLAYRLTLGVGFAAGILQIGLGLVRAGRLGEIFPASAVHGMLAAIGIIIFAKQLPVVLGEAPGGATLETLAHLPGSLLSANPKLALIGLISLALMFGWPSIKRSVLVGTSFEKLPVQLVVVGFALLLASALGLAEPHSYSFLGRNYDVTLQALVPMPKGILESLAFPRFEALSTLAGWKWIFMLTVIGSLESVISARAIDRSDPFNRSTDLSRDLTAVGVCNALAALVGGLPMISEIVRSKTNIDSGAVSRKANFFHGVFVLVAMVALRSELHHVPMAALAAMLVYTGFRLAHPREFINAYRIEREQLVIFAATVMATLATDLLVGIGIGILVKVFLHWLRGVDVRTLLKVQLVERVNEQGDFELAMENAAIFTHWMAVHERLETEGRLKRRDIIVDLSRATLVDHTVLARLEDFAGKMQKDRLRLTIRGLDVHHAMTPHPLASRIRTNIGPSAEIKRGEH